MKTPTERDGVWIDDMGACKVCDGEIPCGHTNECGIFKLEKQVRDQMDTIRKLEAENGRIGELCQQLYDALIHMRSCGQCAEDNWSHCEDGKEAEAAIELFEKSHK